MLKVHYQRHPWLMAALTLAITLTLFFAVRFVSDGIYWARHDEETVRPWMTVGYIGRSWNLDPDILDETAGLPKPVTHPLTLAEIARQRGVPVAEVIDDVEAAIARLQSE